MATFTVTTTADSGAGSLRQAVLDANAAPGEDSIVFDAAFDGGAEDVIRLTGGQIAVTGRLNIFGGPARVTITGDAAGDDVTDGAGITDVAASGAAQLDDNSRIFDASAPLKLDGLVLTGGRTTGEGEGGGAVHTSDDRLVLIDCTVSGNSTTGDDACGGGIGSDFGTKITLAGSRVSGNSTTGDRASGGGAYGNIVILTNSRITDNSTIGDGAYGGGIRGGTVTLSNSTVSGNSTTGRGAKGGGIGGWDVVTLSSSTVSGNSTSDQGGGIFTRSGVTLTSSTVSGNSAAGSGGGILGYYVEVLNSTVNANSAVGSGGGIATRGTFSPTSTTIVNSTISGNSAAGEYGRGGGVEANYVTLRSSTVSGNSSDRAGGGVWAWGYYLGGTPLDLSNSIVLGNRAIDADSAEIGTWADGPIRLSGGNIVGRDVFSGATDIGDTSAAKVFDGTVRVARGVWGGELADNGGPTETIALRLGAGNPAIDLADGATATTADQRGVPRGPYPDLGAFELQGLVLVGGPKPDQLTGWVDGDALYGQGGNDTLRGLGGDDRLFGGAGADRLVGGKGEDLLEGGGGRDLLNGGPGNDRLKGGPEADTLLGGAGSDRLAGNAGDDLLEGNDGADRFVFGQDFGRDTIADFDANPAGGQDVINLRLLGISAANFDDLVTIADLGRDTLVTVEDGGTILCRGVTGDGANTIDASDFLLLA